MKRMFVLLICVVMIFAIAACGKVDSNTPSQNTVGDTQTTIKPNDVTENIGDVGSTHPTDNNEVTTAPTSPDVDETTNPTTSQKPDSEQGKEQGNHNNGNENGEQENEGTTPPVIIVPPAETTPTETPVPTPTEPPTTQPVKPEPIKTTNINLSVDSVKLYVGEKATIVATVKPNNATDKTVKWTSSNTSVATVVNGTVTAHKVGTATITATASGGQTATCKVTVEKKEEPKPTEPTEPKPTEPEKPSEQEETYVGYEIVSMNSPEQAILTRFYGKNKAFLKNDSMTIRIKMSNGTATKDDISVMEAYQCSYSISGDQVTVKFNGTKKQSILTLSIKNSDGSFDKVIFDVIVVQTENLSKDAGRLKELFVQYGNKNGLAFVPNGNDFVEKYNGGYTRDDKSKSITGCTIRGTDDYIRIVDNSDWIFEVLDLIDAYRNKGFNKWSFGINMGGGFSTLAE